MSITISNIVPTSNSVIVNYKLSGDINKDDFMIAVVRNIGQLIHSYELVRNPKMGVDMDIVEDIVCRVMKISPSSLNSKSRSREKLVPRQIAHYMAKQFTAHCLAEIGERFGQRNHATVLHSIKTTKDVWLNSLEYENDIKEIESELIKFKKHIDKVRLESLING